MQGSAGLGKSFLLDAVVRHTELTVLRGRAWEEGGAPPYWPWLEVAAAGGWPLEPAAGQDPFALCADVLAQLRSQAASCPLLVALDDLHAADDDSLRLTRYVARAVGDLPVLLLAAARPSDRLAGLDVLRVDLPPLDDEAAAEVVQLWASDQLDEASQRRVVEQAEGNPLHLRELARLSSRSAAAPDGLRATVLRRLVVLDAGTREMLDAAAVLGRDFDLRDVAGVLGCPPAALLPRLDAAQSQGMVMPAGGTAWRFNHQLQRDAAYGALPVARRADLHARAGDALRASGAGAAEIARHLLHAVPAADPAAALASADSAAAEAVAAGALSEATALLERALPLVPPSGRLAALLRLGALQLRAGQITAAHTTFDTATTAARRAGSAAGLAEAALGRTARLISDLTVTEHLPLLGESLTRSATDGLDAAAARLHARRSVVLSGLDRVPAARADAEAAVSLARRLSDAGVLAEALGALHMTCWEAGREQEAAQVSHELVDVSRAAGDDDRLVEALLARLVDALRAADLADVDAALDELVAVADRTGVPRHRYFADSRLAMRAFLAGRVADGDRLSERARQLGEQIEEPDAFQVFTGSRLFVLADLLSGDELVQQAEMFDREFLAQSPAFAWVSSAVWLAAGRPDRAVAAIRSSLDAPHAAPPTAMELSFRAQAAAAGEDRELAGWTEPLLRPYAGTVLVNAGAVTVCGVVDHYLGLLSACLGRVDAARRDLLAARAVYERLQARHFLGRVDESLAALESSTGTAIATRTAVLRRAGDGWEAGFTGATVVLPDLRGLQHLSALLQRSGHEVPATELSAPGRSALMAAEARAVLLDEAAKRAYRGRVAALKTALEEVEDAERETALRAELDALLASCARGRPLRA